MLQDSNQNPATMLMAVIRIAATASRCVKRERRPWRHKTRLRWPVVAPSFGLGLIDQSGVQVGIDGHLFARKSVEVNRAVTSEMRTAPWLITTY
jgi:hypothetical protein